MGLSGLVDDDLPEFDVFESLARHILAGCDYNRDTRNDLVFYLRFQQEETVELLLSHISDALLVKANATESLSHSHLLCSDEVEVVAQLEIGCEVLNVPNVNELGPFLFHPPPFEDFKC